jgi:hypothetical protein
MSDLAELSFVKSYLKIANDTDDQLLGLLIRSCSVQAESLMERKIKRNGYARKLDGTGTAILMLPEYPVQDVVHLSIEGFDVPLSENNEPGYYFDDISVRMIGGYFSAGQNTNFPYLFPKGQQNIDVHWEAGYDTVPEDIQLLVVQLVSDQYRYRDRVGESSKNLGGMTTSYFAQALTKWQQSVVESYRRVAPI